MQPINLFYELFFFIGVLLGDTYFFSVTKIKAVFFFYHPQFLNDSILCKVLHATDT
jgi:hypothetical protein